uniref:Uncharacterized protein n=1 Tax=Acrobeloides nanus TaxID=290746 RepID=A0A914DV41_9BILA
MLSTFLLISFLIPKLLLIQGLKEEQCTNVGHHPEIYAPNCKSWAFVTFLALDYYKISPQGFDEFKKLLTNILEPCSQQNISTSFISTAPENNQITCGSYEECKESLSKITLEQATSKDNQILPDVILNSILNYFNPALQPDTRTFKIVFPIVMFNQSQKLISTCHKILAPLVNPAEEFVKLYTLGESDSLLNLTESLTLCETYGTSTPPVQSCESLRAFSWLVSLILLIGHASKSHL